MQIDQCVRTINPGILPDGSNNDDAPTARTDPNICKESCSEVTDFKLSKILLIWFSILKGIVDVQQHIVYAHKIDSKCVNIFSLS